MSFNLVVITMEFGRMFYTLYVMLDSYQGLDKQYQQGEEKVYLNVGRLYNVAALKTTNNSSSY